jgi:mannose-6-phosphate isomerase-like protein (cupin superfamily)
MQARHHTRAPHRGKDYNPRDGGAMRLLAALILALVPVTLLAQPQATTPAAPAAALKMFQTSADVAAIVARAKALPPQPLRVTPLFQASPYTVNVEYRTAVATASVHETEAELFYVIDGSGTFVIGGQLTEPQRTNAQNLTGKGITGGAAQKVVKGDFMWVPAGAPHWFSAIDGTVTLMSLHLPVQK